MEKYSDYIKSKYDKALLPRVGLVIEFEREGDLLRYLNTFFPEHFGRTYASQKDNLASIGAFKTIVKTDFFSKPISTCYQLDCNVLLTHLGLLDSDSAQDNIQLYTIQEVAKIISVTRQTVYNLINLGYFNPIQLKGIKGQRIKRIEVIKYLDNQQSYQPS